MNEKRAILFDIDGTIFSSEEMIGETYREGFERYRTRTGRTGSIPTHTEIMAQIGKPIREIFANLAPDLSMEEQHALSEEILITLVDAIQSDRGIYYGGAIELLHRLHEKGYELYGASNGRLRYVEAVLKHGGVYELFTEVPVVDNVSIFNKNDLVQFILSSHSIAPEKAVMVGDRASDRDAAVVNGVDFIACRYGHGSSSEWEGARALIDSPLDILELSFL